MSNFTTRKLSCYFVLTFLTLTILPGTLTSASNYLAIVEKPYSSLTRDWEDISLLYDNYYHNSSETNEEIDRFQSLVPELIDIEVIGHSYLGKDIRVVKITNEERTYQKAKSLVISHHHGREQITVEAALRFIMYLLNNYQENQQITDFIDYQEIYVIPTINPDALDIVVDQGDYWLRKNLRPWDDDQDGLFEEDHIEDVDLDGIVSSFDVYDNTNPSNPIYLYTYYEGIDNDDDGLINEDTIGYTDLNRNYDSYWRNGPGWEDDTQSEVYPGPTPFSEPETQAVRDFMIQHRFAMAYSLHSGTNATLFSENNYGWTEPSLYWQIVQDYRSIIPNSYTDIYFEPENILQAHKQPSTILAGNWDIWAYFERNVLVPITFEIYTNLSSVLPTSERIVLENSTHLILEWFGIYGYFTPEYMYINDLWNDIRSAFDYLLINTPRLDFQDMGASYFAKSNDHIVIGFDIKNLSPRLNTIQQIGFYDSSFTLIFSHIMLYASYSNLWTFDTYLSVLENTDGNYTFFIGNDYVGYREFIIQVVETENTNSGYTIGLSIVGLVIMCFCFKKFLHGKSKFY